jgi:hypothetical protein
MMGRSRQEERERSGARPGACATTSRHVGKDAAVHDSQELDGLLDKGNTCNDVFADSARYAS